MRRIFLGFAFSLLWWTDQVGAVENIATSSFNLKPPTEQDIPGWSVGWAQPAVQSEGFSITTGWNYVGSINGNSATYLGQGWVLTAAHNHAGDLNLAGKRYPLLAHSAQRLGFTDLLLFQVSPYPDLPSLPLRTAPPVPGESRLAILGFGGPDTHRDESWGYGIVTEINQRSSPSGSAATSSDFLVMTGKIKSGAADFTNNYRLVTGDSGGPGFIWEPVKKRWELAGIAEFSGAVSLQDHSLRPVSGFVQLDSYAALINKIMGR